MRKYFIFILLFFAVSINAQSSTQVDTNTATESQDFLEDFEAEFHPNVNDPLIGYNRFMHTINWGIYDYAFSPLLDAYRTAMPQGYQLGIYNFFDNLAFPLRFTASLLSGELKFAMDELGRFVLSSTVGLFGLMDVASQNGLYSHHNDFGITFGKWGIGSGFHFVIPILGPSNLRDAIAPPLNMFAYPTNYIEPAMAAISVDIVSTGNYMARHKSTLDSMRETSLDSYLLFRDSYEQRRAELISE